MAKFSTTALLKKSFSLQPKFQKELETGRPHSEMKLQSGVETALEDGEKHKPSTEPKRVNAARTLLPHAGRANP